MPHILPCPAPRTTFSDVEITEDGRRRRRRRIELGAVGDSRVDESREVDADTEAMEEGKFLVKKAHECPVPKPGGLIGQVLGFKGGKGDGPVVEREATDSASRSSRGEKR